MLRAVRKVRGVDSVALLENLLTQARHGLICGLAMCSKDSFGREEISFTGDYGIHPAQGVNAAARMQYRLAQLQDDTDAASDQHTPQHF